MPARPRLSARVRAWGLRGHPERFRGRRIHCLHQDGEGPLLLLLHGFPTCSYDWRALLALEHASRVLAFDFLGFGLSEKPPEHHYTLAWQADLAEELVRRHGGGAVYLVAHDMGTSVATELLARDKEGALGMDLVGALLFNGSMIIERASLTPGQRMLRSRLGPLLAPLSSGAFFRQQLGSVFSAERPLSPEAADDDWDLMRFGGGNRIAHKLIGYTFERATFAERWHGALREWPKPLALAWGMRDPVATTSVLDGLRELRPSAPVFELPELAHYPQMEDPGAFQGALAAALASAGRR